MVYPTWYVMFKIYKLGVRLYFLDFSNRIDLLYTIVGILNVFLQSYGEPQSIVNKTFTCFLLLQQLLKSFFYLRVFG